VKGSGGIVSGNAASGNVVISNGTVRRTATITAGIDMSRSELSQRRERLQRKLAASFEGWHSGRVDRLEEALRAIERELDTKTATQRSKHH